MALFLLSDSFFHSDFIESVEVKRLMARRRDHGVRVVPIILESCTWTLDPVFEGIQVLPEHGTPVTSFSVENDKRDRVWTDIVLQIAEVG